MSNSNDFQTARLLSDYSVNRWLRITSTCDNDICISLQGDENEEFRIATAGSRYQYSEYKHRFFALCNELIEVMDLMENERRTESR